MAFETKLPPAFTEQDLADLKKEFSSFNSERLEKWAKHLLKKQTPAQAVETLRALPEKLWPELAAAIALKSNLMKEFPAPVAGREPKPPLMQKLGDLFDAMTSKERIAAVKKWKPSNPADAAHLIRYLTEFRSSLAPELLPHIVPRAKGSWIAICLIESGLSGALEMGEEVAQRTKEEFERYQAFTALHRAAPERYFSRALTAARESMAGPDENNDHHTTAQWLCQNAGEEGIADVVEYIKTRKTFWVTSVADFSIRVLGDRAWPVIEAARQRGVELEIDRLREHEQRPPAPDYIVQSKSVDELIARIEQNAQCEIVWRDPQKPLLPPGHAVSYSAGGKPSRPLQDVNLPEDMRRFRERIASAELFAQKVSGGVIPQPNGWSLDHTELWGGEPITDQLSDYEPGTIWDQLTHCYIFACAAGDGAQLLAVDLRPEKFGFVVECYVDQMVDGGNVPVVAHSFTEWLERTLEAGPKIDAGYWEEQGFKDYGPAMDGDPTYEERPRG